MASSPKEAKEKATSPKGTGKSDPEKDSDATQGNFGLWDEDKPASTILKITADDQTVLYPSLLVEHFVNLNGFDLMLQIVKDEKTDMTQVRQCVKPFVSALPLLKTEFGQAQWEAAQPVFYEKLHKLLNPTTGSLSKNDQKTFRDIADAIKSILGCFMPKEQASLQLLKFDLEENKNKFNAPNLERQLKGLKDIRKECLGFIQKEKKSGWGWGIPNVLKKEEPNLRRDFFMQWIEENEVVERCFKLGHPEVIKNAVVIMTLFAQQGRLKRQMLDLLFDTQLGAHESVKHNTFGLMGELCRDLSQEETEYLFKKFIDIPKGEYDLETLAFVTKLAGILAEKTKNKEHLFNGLNIAWELIQDNTPVSLRINAQAFHNLVELLSLPECASKRNDYLDKAAHNMAENKTVFFSMKLIVELLQKTQKSKDAAKKIKSLDESHHLLDSFIASLTKYKDKVRKKAEKEDPNRKNLNDIVYTGKHNHTEELEGRLSFLEYLLLHSSLSISPQQIDLLWDLLVTNATTLEERQRFFNFLSAMTSDSKDHYVPISGATVEHLFTVKMIQTLDCTDLNLTTFDLFVRFFLFSNEKSGKLRRIDPKEEGKRPVYFALDSALSGMKNLWIIALESQNPDIAIRCQTLVNGLFSLVSPESMKPKLAKVREEYLSACLEQLLASLKVPDSPAPARCLEMLTSFTVSFNSKAPEEEEKVTEKESEPLHLQIRPQVGIIHTLDIPELATVAQLRTQVGRLLHRPPRGFRLLTSDNRELKNGEKTLKDYKIDANTTQILVLDLKKSQQKKSNKEEEEEEHQAILQELHFDSRNALLTEALRVYLGGVGVTGSLLGYQMISNAGRKSSPEPQSKKAATPQLDPNNRALPAVILAEPKFFDQLYAALSGGEEVGERVLSLLDLLPANSATVKQLRATEDWKSVVDPKQGTSSRANALAFQSIYGLKAIRALLVDIQFREKFLKTSGMNHLLSLLMKMDIDSLATSSKMLLGLSVSVINNLLCEGDGLGVIRPTAAALAGVKPKSLANRLFTLISRAANKAIRSPADELLLSSTTDLFFAVLHSDEALTKNFLNQADLEGWLGNCLLESPIERARERVAEGLISITHNKEDGRKVLGLLLRRLPHIDNFQGKSKHYFSTLSNLVTQSGDEDLNHKEFLDTIITTVDQHPVSEATEDGPTDDVLVGLLNIMKAIFRKKLELKFYAQQARHVIQLILDSCLFQVGEVEGSALPPPKCKTLESRTAAFRLLLELASNCDENFIELTTLLEVHINSFRFNPYQWTYVPEPPAASRRFVGLKNQGNTCYMNSLVQQLYHTPSFRQGLLQANLPEATQDLDDNIVYQLQYLFAYLQESKKSYYDTMPFCRSVKDFDGNPINVGIQMDANEFFNNLLDKLETGLKGSEQASLLDRIFRGHISNQLISKECPHRSERSEPFYALSIEVKNKQNVAESMELYIQGEMLSGDNKYKCDSCNKGVDALKRVVLRDLPPVLILHLKRFEFDFEKMRNEKLYDRYEFPMELNLEPYTLEGINRRAQEMGLETFEPEGYEGERDPWYYQYRLRGIVVHAGSSDSGHYYSYIKDRVQPANGPPLWHEFNDTQVLRFDPDHIPAECFGGFVDFRDYDKETQQYVMRKRAKSHSAYILVYERISNGPDAELEASLGSGSESKDDDSGRLRKPTTATSQKAATESKDEAPKEPKEPTKKSSKRKSKDKSKRSSEDPAEKKGDGPDAKVEEKPADKPAVAVTKAKASRDSEPKNGGLADGRTGKTLVAFVPQPILSGIQKENAESLLGRYIFSNSFFNFIWGLCHAYDKLSPVEGGPDPHFRTAQFAFRFVYSILARSKDRPMFSAWIDRIGKLLNENKAACRWFLTQLTTSNDMLTEMFFYCGVENVRIGFGALVSGALRSMAEIESGYYSEGVSLPTNSQQPNLTPEQIEEMARRPFYVTRFLHNYVGLLKFCRTMPRSSAQYFIPLRDFAAISARERSWLLQQQLLPTIHDFVNQKNDFAQKAPTVSNRTGLTFTSAGSMNYRHLAELLSILVRSCGTDWKQGAPEGHLEGDLNLAFNPRNSIVRVVFDADFIVKLLSDANSSPPVMEIVKYWSWEDKSATKFWADCFDEEPISPFSLWGFRHLTTKVDRAQLVGQLKPYLELFEELLSLRDGLWGWRIDYVMSSYWVAIANSLPSGTGRVSTKTEKLIMWIFRRAQEHEPIREWIGRNFHTVNDLLNQVGYKVKNSSKYVT